jgi:hypothetical protein
MAVADMMTEAPLVWLRRCRYTVGTGSKRLGIGFNRLHGLCYHYLRPTEAEVAAMQAEEVALLRGHLMAAEDILPLTFWYWLARFAAARIDLGEAQAARQRMSEAPEARPARKDLYG